MGYGLGGEVEEVRKERGENGVAEGFFNASIQHQACFPSNQHFFFLVDNKTTRSISRGVGLDI